jgi:anti-sigma regulatory factor (Ser/Thr protein kinase)
MAALPGTIPPPAHASGPDGRAYHPAIQGAPPGDPGATPRPLLEQAFGPGSLPALRAAVHAHAARAGMPKARADDLTLAAHELAVNAIQHGAGHGRLLMWHQDGMLHCQVEDDGPARQARRDPAGPGQNQAAQWPRRQPHGLWLARALADQMTIMSGPSGTRAAVAFTLPDAPARPARRALPPAAGCV